MLIELQFENFSSFKEKNVFSMEPASQNGKNPNVFSTGLRKIPELFRTAGIFGPNAAGKTNFCKVFAFLQYLLQETHKNNLDSKFPNVVYALRSDTADYPLRIELKFIVQQDLYEYMITLSGGLVEEEHLYLYPIAPDDSARKNTIFERKYQNGKYVLGRKSVGILQSWSDETIYTRSFLSEIVNNRNCQVPEVLKAYQWMTGKLKIIDHKVISEGFSLKQIADGNGQKIIDLIKKADLGLEDLKVRQLPKDEIIQGIKNQMPELANQYLAKLDDGHHLFLAPHSYHKKEDGSLKEFNFDKDESTGTKSFLTLSGPLLQALENGETIVVDEMDMALHPHLMRYLVFLFNSPKHNVSNAQLIFTSHAYYLMDGQYLSRDQIWLTSKELNSGFFSDLYSLADMKNLKRKKAEFYDAYINGVYGAVPHVEDFDV